MKSNKILLFSTAYLPFVGGAEVSVKEITDRIPDIEFHMITAKMKRGLPFREKVGNILVYRLGIGVPIIDKLLLPFEGAMFVRHLQKKHEYSAYWCIMATFASGAAYIANFFNKVKVPVILNLQEGDSESHLTYRWFGLLHLSWKMALKRTSFLTVLSNYLKERALRLGYKGQVEIIPNGVNVYKFEKEISKEGKMEMRKRWGVGEDDVVLITTSRLTKKNGIGYVIRALPKLSLNTKFVVCGEGELESELKNLAKELGVSGRVIFEGTVSHADLPKYLKSSDIFIRPSLSEGFGVSFIEAYASRVPVVATRVGGIADFLEDGKTGYVCDPSNPESVAQAVQRCVLDENRDLIIQNAYNMTREKYDWNLIASQMKGIFDRITK